MFDPWQETFADAGDGDGVGDHLGPFYANLKTILTQFWIILRPPCPPNYVFRPKINFLEMAHTNFISSIRERPFQLLIWTKNNKKHVFGYSNISKITSKKKNMFIYTENDSESHRNTRNINI